MERTRERFPGVNFKDSLWYQVGATEEDFSEVMRVDRVFGDTNISSTEYGRAMDYPETAVQAYEQYQMTEDKSLLVPIYDPRLTDEEIAFTNSRLSEANWEEEILWREQLMAGVLEYSPKIYNEIIENFQVYLEKKREREREKQENVGIEKV
jgi:hypothetical protein